MASTEQTSPTAMNASMNMAITIFGFVLSSLFIMLICCRLICSRFRRSQSAYHLDTEISRTIGGFPIPGILRGLEQSVLTCFPTVKFNQHIFTSTEDNMCTICLSDYKENELLRILPRCGHTFHACCIDPWLRQHFTCPVCRISLRIFADWGHVSGPLISFSAKPRFVPGALPESLFELPKDFQSMVPVALPMKGSDWPMVVRDDIDPERGEASTSQHFELLQIVDELESRERQHDSEHSFGFSLCHHNSFSPTVSSSYQNSNMLPVHSSSRDLILEDISSELTLAHNHNPMPADSSPKPNDNPSPVDSSLCYGRDVVLTDIATRPGVSTEATLCKNVVCVDSASHSNNNGSSSSDCSHLVLPGQEACLNVVVESH